MTTRHRTPFGHRLSGRRAKFSRFETDFDGFDDRAEVLPLNATISGITGALTVGVWATLPASSAFQTVLDSGTQVTVSWTIQRTVVGGAPPNRRWWAEVYDPTGALKRYQISFDTFADGERHLLLFTYAPGGVDGILRIYFDDTEDATPNKLIDGLVPSLRVSTLPRLFLGAFSSPGGPTQNLLGRLDDPFVFATTFTPAQVVEAYNGGVPMDMFNHSAAAAGFFRGYWLMGDGDTFPTILERVVGGAGYDATMVNMTAGDFVRTPD